MDANEKAAQAKVDSQVSASAEAAGSGDAQVEAQSSNPQENPNSGDRPNGVDPVAMTGDGSVASVYDYWMSFATQTVRSRVVLKKMPETEAELVEILKASAVAKIQTNPGLNTIIKVWEGGDWAASLTLRDKCQNNLLI